jgi:hypothetical protein
MPNTNMETPSNPPSNKKKKKKRTSFKGQNNNSDPQNRGNQPRNNVQSNNKKRKPDQPLDGNKRSRTNDYRAPEDRVVYLPSKKLKDQFALPFAPVQNGLRDDKGEIVEKPLGGPLGLLDYFVDSTRTTAGRAAITNLCGDYGNAMCVAHVLTRTVGGVDKGTAAFSLRLLLEENVKAILSASLDVGLKILSDRMKWDPNDEELRRRLKNFNTDEFFALWAQRRKEYENRLSQLDESRRSKTSTPNVDSNMDVESDL